MPTQTMLDFQRGEQLGMIRDARLPNRSRSAGLEGVSAATLKLVLRTLDDFGRGRECYASQETIGKACELSRATIKRSIAALLNLSLIIVERKRNQYGVNCNHYRIVWTELSVLTKGSREATKGSPCATKGSPCANQGLTGEPQSAKETKTRSARSNSGNQKIDQKDFEQAVEYGRGAFASLKPRKPADRQLVARVCLVAATELSEHWLNDVIGGARLGRDRFAMLLTVAREAASRLHGVEFDQLIPQVPRAFYVALERPTVPAVTTHTKPPPRASAATPWKVLNDVAAIRRSNGWQT